MGYREDYFKAHPGKKRFGRRGTWYKCVNCGQWYSKTNITIDHRIPLRKGGTNDLWNLQPMCRSCNSGKRDRNTRGETAKTLVKATVHGGLGKAVGSMAKRKVKDVFGVKYNRDKVD